MAQHRVKVTTVDGRVATLKADVVLIATGASPRVLPNAVPDGERILNWRQLYDLDRRCPSTWSSSGSGVTGAEFCNAYTELGVPVTVVASRDQILPHEDSDAAAVLEEAFAERGVKLVKNARADSVTRTADGVVVKMADGRTRRGQPRADDSRLGAQHLGTGAGEGRHRAGRRAITCSVDRVSRTTASGIYAAGDCTGLLPLASVAAMQGRIAMYHALGEGGQPDPAADRRRGGVHPAGDRRRRGPADGDRQRHGAGANADAAAQHQCQGEDVAAAPAVS